MNNKYKNIESETMQNADRQVYTGLLSGLFFLSWAGVGWYGLLSNESIAMHQKDWFSAGPGMFPFVVLMVLTIGAGCVLIKALIGLRRSELAAPRTDWRQHAYAVSGAISVAVLVAGMQAMGFLFGALIFCGAWLVILGRHLPCRARRMITLSSTYAVLITGSVYFVFADLLNVPLP